jgi:predicted neutral ceramidase superfamily lipid hydrolase
VLPWEEGMICFSVFGAVGGIGHPGMKKNQEIASFKAKLHVLFFSLVLLIIFQLPHCVISAFKDMQESNILYVFPYRCFYKTECCFCKSLRTNDLSSTLILLHNSVSSQHICLAFVFHKVCVTGCPQK